MIDSLFLAGYSGTPLPQKLGIREGSRVALVRAPDGFAETLVPMPDGVRLRTRLGGTADVVLFFATRRSELERRFPTMARALEPSGGLWIAWPKRRSGVPTDLDEHVVRTCGLDAGLVDNKVCAIDEVWSGLRFVYRVRDRPGRG